MELPPGVWLDRRPLQRSWPEPDPPLRIPRWARIGVPLLVLALVAGVVVGLGGLQKRQDLLTTMAPGVELDCVQMIYTFDSATAQPVERHDGTRGWDVVVSGTVRNPHDEPFVPKLGEVGSYVARALPAGQVVVPSSSQVGPALDQRSTVPPGNVPFDLELTFELDDTYQPTDWFQVATFLMEFTDNSVLGLNDERVWNKTDRAWTVYVPVTQLPEETDTY